MSREETEIEQPNVAFVRELFDRWNRGEREFSDDEIDPALTVLTRLQSEPFRGRDGLSQWIKEIDEQFKEWQLVVDEWREVGDRVVGLGHIRLRGGGSGVEFDQPMGWLVAVRDGRVLQIQPFVNPQDALEAAGLSD